MFSYICNSQLALFTTMQICSINRWTFCECILLWSTSI